MDVLLLLLLTAIILIHTWPKEGALIIVRYRNVAINNKGRLPPPTPAQKKNHSLVLGLLKIALKVQFE